MYVVSDGEVVKIGHTKDLFNRVSQLQTGNARRLEIVSHFEFPSRQAALDAERRAHRAAKHNRLEGEWFTLHAVDVCNEVLRLSKADPVTRPDPGSELSQRLSYSVEEAATLLGVSRRTMYKLFSQGLVRTRKIGSRRVVTRAELLSFLERGAA
ncbi:MAG: helix-turn-helix domain-containing protein [Pseudomonadales bacterium]